MNKLPLSETAEGFYYEAYGNRVLKAVRLNDIPSMFFPKDREELVETIVEGMREDFDEALKTAVAFGNFEVHCNTHWEVRRDGVTEASESILEALKLEGFKDVSVSSHNGKVCIQASFNFSQENA